MKNNIKLFFKSLFSNNTAIDCARKKPWYAAIIIFFVSMIISLVPTLVNNLNVQLDKKFDDKTYCTEEATTHFVEWLNAENIDVHVEHDKTTKKDYLVWNSEHKTHEFKTDENTRFVFTYCDKSEVEAKLTLLNAGYTINENKVDKFSYFLFTSDTVYLKILNQNDESVVIEEICTNAYKNVGTNAIKESFSEVSEDGQKNYLGTIDKTWKNWKSLLRNFYNYKRVTLAWIQVGIFAIVNVSISLLMGLMVWILTRGKNNPYRLFSVWECFKISSWSCITPALLACGFGFLFSGIANALFPLLLGVRVMWLSMKSLKPDGSGYAAD